MQQNQQNTPKVVLLTLGAVVLTGVAALLVVVYSGAVNVAASSAPSAFVRWILETTREHSVATRAADISVPALDGQSMQATGAEHFDEMCVDCHGAPGKPRGEAAEGLEPPPPKLFDVHAMSDTEAAQTFWVIKNGIQMTGMPSFAKTHDDEKIWAIVAFLKHARGMTPDQYQKATAAN